MRGIRVKNIVRELSGEKIDIVRWHDDVKTFVTNALAPASLMRVMVDPDVRTVTVVVDTDQLSLAIGKKGQNARLTAKLSGWKIDIQKDEEQIGFEEKVARAVDALAAVEGIGAEYAETLVQGGFLTTGRHPGGRPGRSGIPGGLHPGNRKQQFTGPRKWPTKRITVKSRHESSRTSQSNWAFPAKNWFPCFAAWGST